MQESVDTSNQRVISIEENEMEFFTSFTAENNIHWPIEEKNNAVLLLSKAYVGYIVTPSRKIELLPKYSEIGFEHVFRMYLYTYGYRISEDGSILDISGYSKDLDIANLYFENLRKNIQIGIIRTYNMQEQKDLHLKGKVDLVKTYIDFLKGKRKYVTTRHSLLSLDNDFNNLIVAALNKLLHIEKYVNEAKQLKAYFSGVEGKVDQGKSWLQKIVFNNNTSRYRKTLLYAAMIVDQLDYHDVGSSVGSESFIINFDRLFEDFVVKILKEVPKQRKFSTWRGTEKFGKVIAQNYTSDYREYNPDILYDFKEEDEDYNYSPSAYAVLDVKNKAYGLYRNADIYQICMYATLLHSKKALLLYPSFSNRESDYLQLDSEIFSPDTIEACYINIAAEDGDDFLDSIDYFVKTVEDVILDLE